MNTRGSGLKPTDQQIQNAEVPTAYEIRKAEIEEIWKRHPPML